jgi:hypothetical protein
MSYIYLQEQGEESSAESFSDIEQCVLWKSNPQRVECYSPDSATECSTASRYGMMSRPSTGDRGMGLLMSCAVASPARTSQAQEQEQESTASEADYGARWQELSVRFDPSVCSWKTHQCLWEEDLPWSSVTLPRWGMMRRGVCLELATSAVATSGNDAGYLLPTPTASDYKRTPMKKSYAERPSTLGVPDDLAKWAVRESGLDHARLVPDLWEWAMAWPEQWTESKPVETDKFQSWLQRHGAFSPAN